MIANTGSPKFVAERRPMKTTNKPIASKKSDELSTLTNVGTAMRGDFAQLGIENIAQLAKQDADELYTRLSKITGCRQDPCVWDTFAATIHQAKTGEVRAWWTFTPLRKERQKKGTFI
jgi:hypothetical protein